MKKVLIFGGTGFMGRTLVSHLLNENKKNNKDNQWEISILNRGKPHWSKGRLNKENHNLNGKIEQAFPVNRINCNREDESSFSSVLQQLSNESWDLVVDFSSFEKKDVEMIVERLKNKMKHYIFISSDSVYMVCANPSTSRPFGRNETDSIRPSSREERDYLNSKDSYGNGKLECEEFLQQSFQQYSLPCTSLRLPDVFGPFDRTDRHWKYQLWLTVSEKFPIELSEESKTKRLGFVFSEDVVSAIMKVIQHGKKTFGQSYNVACQETPTLEQYLSQTSYLLTQSSLALTELIPFSELPQSDSEDSDSSDGSSSVFSLDSEFLPSVDFGHINIEKIMNELQWKPTPLHIALEKTVTFFEKAFFEYPNMVPLDEFDSEMRESIRNRYQSLLKSPNPSNENKRT